MFSRESLARQWKTIPPLGVLALCLIYAMFALRVLIMIAPSIGEKDTNWPHHGAFYPWDFFWETVFVLISFSVLVASSATLTRNRVARSWLSILLVTSIVLGYAQSAHYIFLQYQFQSNGPLPLREIMSIFWFPISEMVYGSAVVVLVLLAHYWFFFRASAARRFFSGDSDA